MEDVIFLPLIFCTVLLQSEQGHSLTFSKNRHAFSIQHVPVPKSVRHVQACARHVLDKVTSYMMYRGTSMELLWTIAGFFLIPVTLEGPWFFFFLSFSFLSLSPFEIYVLCMSGAVDSVTPSLLKTGTCFSFYYGW